MYPVVSNVMMYIPSTCLNNRGAWWWDCNTWRGNTRQTFNYYFHFFKNCRFSIHLNFLQISYTHMTLYFWLTLSFLTCCFHEMMSRCPTRLKSSPWRNGLGIPLLYLHYKFLIFNWGSFGLPMTNTLGIALGRVLGHPHGQLNYILFFIFPN